MALTDTICKSAKPKEKPYKLADSGGLYLEIMPNGSKYWRLKYRFQKKEKRLAFGAYPTIKLVEAREARENAKKLLSENIDPSIHKKINSNKLLEEANNTFEAIANEWMHSQQERWTPNYSRIVKKRLEKDIFPFIGKMQIVKIDPPLLLNVLRKIEHRDALYLAKRARQICSLVFRYGIQTGRCKYNPASDLTGALKSRPQKHFAAINAEEIPTLLQNLENNSARLFGRTRRAIKLSLLTFVRPGELRQASWSEFDFEKKEWRIPAERMKARKEHIIPLSNQAIKILNEQKEETGNYKTGFVFPSQILITKPMSENTVRVALQKLGFKDRMTAHGFRALARTTIREELDYEPDVIEAQLAHKPMGALGAAYDRAKFIKKRHVMMQEWADYIDRITVEAKNKIVAFKS